MYKYSNQQYKDELGVAEHVRRDLENLVVSSILFSIFLFLFISLYS